MESSRAGRFAEISRKGKATSGKIENICSNAMKQFDLHRNVKIMLNQKVGGWGDDSIMPVTRMVSPDAYIFPLIGIAVCVVM